MRSCLVPQCSYPPYRPRHQWHVACELWLDACILHQRTTFRSSQASNLLSLFVIEPQSLARRAMEPGHLFHSTLTRPSNADARRLKSRHPLVPAAQLISSSDNNIRAAHWADHQWNAEWADNPTRLRICIPNTVTHPPEWSSQEGPGSGFTASAPVSGVSAPACTNWIWPPLRPVNVAQKNKPSTTLSYNV